MAAERFFRALLRHFLYLSHFLLFSKYKFIWNVIWNSFTLWMGDRTKWKFNRYGKWNLMLLNPSCIFYSKNLFVVVPHLPPLSPGRRAMTPSPEKSPPPLGAMCNSPTRRAVTPNPDGCKQTISDYQNLADMQAVIMAQAYQPPPNPLYRSNSVSTYLICILKTLRFQKNESFLTSF